jgi:serine/threonine protein phosphatase PrpC
MAVADGVGGHQGGATASRMAVEQVGRELANAHGTSRLRYMTCSSAGGCPAAERVACAMPKLR